MVENNCFEMHLRKVLDGRSTFDEFARGTKRELTRMAMYLIRRWTPPAWYVVDDVVQELLIGVWICVWDWAPSMGPTLSRYVIFNAMGHAKRALHKARGAKLSGSSDRNPSRFERPLSSFGVDAEGDAMAEALLAEEPVAEAAMIEREEREAERAAALAAALVACRTETERAIISALAAAEDIDDGAETIYDDIDRRIELRLTSEAHARRLVMHSANTVILRSDSMLATGS